MKPTRTPCAKTQGRRLIAKLKRKTYTNGELQDLKISTCHHKRIAECLAPHELLLKVKGRDGLLRYRVVSATKWTA